MWSYKCILYIVGSARQRYSFMKAQLCFLPPSPSKTNANFFLQSLICNSYRSFSQLQKPRPQEIYPKNKINPHIADDMTELGYKMDKHKPLELSLTQHSTQIQEGFSDTVETCAACLLKGGVIAVPTDTIYGVAGLVQNSSAVDKIYAMKGRNQEKPIAISVAEIDNIYRWSKVTVSRQVLTDLLPGPVTVVLERSDELNPAFNPHTSLVGVRIPDHEFMQSLAKHCNSPIALTSANISGSTSCLQIKEFAQLWPQLDAVVNGGTLSDTEESRQGSTVVDLSVSGSFNIIRPGSAFAQTLSCLKDKHGLVERGTLASPDR